uniref:Uncharacterized protein n=1 Tax=Anopheles atroparvus TaxID=41427 RepID=A0AAG5CUZ4_ANOAO
MYTFTPPKPPCCTANRKPRKNGYCWCVTFAAAGDKQNATRHVVSAAIVRERALRLSGPLARYVPSFMLQHRRAWSTPVKSLRFEPRSTYNARG